MDWIRSAHETLMRFPGVGLVPVRWYPTSKDWLPFNTVYLNNEWERVTNADWEWDDGQPGEVWTAPRKWYNGRPPIPGTCTGPLGTPAAWMGLSDSTSPLYSCGTWGAAYDGEYDAEYDSMTYAEE